MSGGLISLIQRLPKFNLTAIEPIIIMLTLNGIMTRHHLLHTYRFSVPGFWTGMACVLSLNGAFMPALQSLHGNAQVIEDVDRRALARDWFAVSNDCQSAIGQLEQEASMSLETLTSG